MNVPTCNQPALTNLDFHALVGFLKCFLETLPDAREGYNTQYTIADAALSALSAFFMQCPSFLEYQRQMAEHSGKDNVRSLFQASAIPSDNQIRNLLDPIAPQSMAPVFKQVFDMLKRHGYLKQYNSVNDTLLLALDATQYFSSQNIHCATCQEKHHNNGEITYSHSAITPVIVSPHQSNVICLPPEFIHQQDGRAKQDCEINAAKRWLETHSADYQPLGVTVLGDDLYSRQPFIEGLQASDFHFILTCKETSHKILYEYVQELNVLGKVNQRIEQRHHGKKRVVDTYRFVNNIPLRDGDDAVNVNWCELVTTGEDGKVIFANTYITDYNITIENCAEIVACGRTRWKIENEHFNILKNKGYHLTHNFGHGKKHLSEMLFTLNVLALLYHTVLQLTEIYYQAIRKKLGSRERFFNHVRVLTTYKYFENWVRLMRFMAEKLEIDLGYNSS